MKEYTVVLGTQRYCLYRPWPSADFDPTGISDVCVMEDGRVVALMRSSPELRVFSPTGELDAEWKVPALLSGHYLSARPNGGLLIADWDGHQILAIDSNGDHVWTIGDPKKPSWNAPFSHPASAAEGDDGRIYVSDGYGNFNLHIFGADRVVQKTLGKPGRGEAEFTTPHCVVVGKDGRVFVTDRENNRIQIFSLEGQWLGQYGNLYKPMALALLPDGGLLVTDQTPALSLFSKNGERLGRLRTAGMYGHGLSCAKDGCIYVSEMLPYNLIKLIPIN